MSLTLPRTAVAARLVLTQAAAANGEVFVIQRVPPHGGPETVLEMLCRPEAFFAFRPTEGKSLLLISKAHTVCVSIEGDAPEADPARLSAARRVGAELRLTDDSTLRGWASVELPPDQSRLLDFLNASPDPFLALGNDRVTHYVNRAHIVYARPLD